MRKSKGGRELGRENRTKEQNKIKLSSELESPTLKYKSADVLGLMNCPISKERINRRVLFETKRE